MVGDIRDAATVRAVTADVDVVVHLAANTGVGPSVEDLREDCDANVLGTLNYLEACRGNDVARFALASSGASIGEAEPPLHEELVPHPASPYGASKLAGERIEIYGDGQQTRDFIYIDDLVEAIRAAARRPAVAGEVFQVVANTETTISELVERLLGQLEALGVARPPVVYGAPRVGDVRRNYSDTSKANKRLGWSCHHHLDAGLARTVDWSLAADVPGARAHRSSAT